jgi:hypothetical protein
MTETWFGLENRKKISQIFNDYTYLSLTVLPLIYFMTHTFVQVSAIAADSELAGASLTVAG